MKMKRDNVLVIGLGYVGLTLSSILAKESFTVYGLDLDNSIISSVKNGKAHFYEKDIDSLISRIINKNLFVSSKIKDFELINFSTIIITVGTPLKENNEPNYDYLTSALRDIAQVYDGKQLIILRSTVSVGTTNKIVIPHLKEILNDSSSKIMVSFCPERTIEGKALSELVELPQIISGNNKESLQKSRSFFSKFNKNIIEVESLEAAELIKLFNNTYRDVNFAVGNIFNEIAQHFGINGLELIQAANKDYQRSSIAMPGLVGGPCLEKDPYILSHGFQEIEEFKFIVQARRFNESLEHKIIKWVKSNYKTGSNILVSGMAFKGRPETSDLRGSSSVSICEKLNKEGYKLVLHDFTVPYKDLKKLNLGNVALDFKQELEKNNIILILTNHYSYEKINLSNWLIENSNIDFKMLDVWNNFNIRSDKRVNNLGEYVIK